MSHIEVREKLNQIKDTLNNEIIKFRYAMSAAEDVEYFLDQGTNIRFKLETNFYPQLLMKIQKSNIVEFKAVAKEKRPRLRFNKEYEYSNDYVLIALDFDNEWS